MSMGVEMAFYPIEASRSLTAPPWGLLAQHSPLKVSVQSPAAVLLLGELAARPAAVFVWTVSTIPCEAVDGFEWNTEITLTSAANTWSRTKSRWPPQLTTGTVLIYSQLQIL